MPVTCSEVEERVIAACEDLKRQEHPNIAKTAWIYNAPEGHVRRRFKGKAPCRLETGGQNKALDDVAEQSLCM